MKRLFTQIILSVFCIQLVMASLAQVNVFAASEPLKNIVENGDMETDTVPSKWVVSSYATGSTLEIKTDSADSGNRVLRFDGTNNTGTVSYISYNEELVVGKQYYYSYKIRIAQDDKNLENRDVYRSYMGLTPAKSETARPLLSKEWVVRSGVVTMEETKKMHFKIIYDLEFGSNVKKVIYELDDIVILDMEVAEVLNLDAELNGATLNWETGVVSTVDGLYAKRGTVASFTLTPPLRSEINSVTVNGTTINPVDDVYSVEIPDDLTLSVNVDVKADNGVPNLLSTSPESGITRVDPKTMALKAEFDRDIDIDSLKTGVTVTPDASFRVEADGDNECTYNLIFDELMEATDYTVVFTENVKSDLGIAMGTSHTFTFTTASPSVNIIENGDMSDTSNLAVYRDNDSGSISFEDDNGNGVLKWKVTYENAPLIQYLNNEYRKKKYNFVGGHTYYVKARVKAEKETKVNLAILYVTDADKTNQRHQQSEVSLEAEKWTVVHNVFTIPADVNLEKSHGIRFGAGKKDEKGDFTALNVYVDDIELIDCSITLGGKPHFVSSYPADNASEVEVGRGELEMSLNFDKPLMPTTVNAENITAEGAVIKDIRMSEDKKTCILSLSQLKVNKTVEINYKNLTSMTNEKVDDGSVSFNTKTVSTATPVITKASPANGDAVRLAGLGKMEIVYNLPLEGPIDKASFSTVPENLIDEVEWSYDNRNVIGIKLNQEVLSAGNTYSITLLPTIKSQAEKPINEETITFSIITQGEIVQEFKEVLADTSQDNVQGVLDFITGYYVDLVPDDTLCEMLLEKDSEVAESLAEHLLEKGISADADADDVIEMIQSNAVLLIVNESQNEELIDAAVKSAFAAENMTAALNTYNALNDSVKTSLCGNIKALTTDFESSQDFINYFENKVVFTAIQNANGWMAISNILNNNIEFWSSNTKTLIKKINSSTNKAAIYLSLQGTDVSNETAVYNTLNNALSTNTKPSGGGGAGGGGGGGAGGASFVTGNKTETPAEKEKTPNVTTKAPSVFKDIDSVPWAKEAIEHFYEMKVISGKTEDSFCPNDFATREEFVKMIVIAGNIPMTEMKHSYSDADQNEWYYPYISAATNAKLVQGTDGLNFGIGQNITRQDIATICSRLLGAAEEDEEEDDAEDLSETAADAISDYADVSEYAKEAVARLASLGIIKGDETGKFAPHRNASRAEIVVMLQRLIAYKNTEGR